MRGGSGSTGIQAARATDTRDTTGGLLRIWKRHHKPDFPARPNGCPSGSVFLSTIAVLLLAAATGRASEADLAIPDLHAGHFNLFGTQVSAWTLLFCGISSSVEPWASVCTCARQIHKLPCHKSMLDVAEIIFQTCKTYLVQQGKFLLMLFVLIAVAISFYLLGFEQKPEYELTDRMIQELELYPTPPLPASVIDPLKALKKQNDKKNLETAQKEKVDKAKFLASLKAAIPAADWETHSAAITKIAAPEAIDPILKVLCVLLFSIVGMGGSYAVAWYGIRVNTYANCPHRLRLAPRRALGRGQHPLAGGHVDRPVPDFARTGHDGDHPAVRAAQIVGYCFLGFAIGESLGASALRIAGGIFTKIADIGSDLMKIVFNVKEDDPRNPGVIADCTGDNAGDSVGPTADGFETYGVTGVALISFITLAVPNVQSTSRPSSSSGSSPCAS